MAKKEFPWYELPDWVYLETSSRSGKTWKPGRYWVIRTTESGRKTLEYLEKAKLSPYAYWSPTLGFVSFPQDAAHYKTRNGAELGVKGMVNAQGGTYGGVVEILEIMCTDSGWHWVD